MRDFFPHFQIRRAALIALASVVALAAPAGAGDDHDPDAAVLDRAWEEDAAGPELPPALLGPAVRDADLAPYATSVAQKAALAALQSGKAARALELLPAAAAKDAPTRWLRALALRAAGKPAEARKLFEQLLLAGGPLADRATHLAALSAIDAGDSAPAERLLSQVSLRFVDADQVLLERARLLGKLKPAGPAAARLIEEALLPIFDGRVRADVATAHLLAGEAWSAAGNKEAARAHFRLAWVEHPLSAAADGALRRERALPGTGAAIPQDRLLHRAEVLLEAHRNHEALDQLARLKVPSLCLGGCPGDRTPAAFLQAALSLLAPEALPLQHQPTPEDIARNPVEPADPLACRAKLNQGRAFRKEHDYAKARAALAPVVLRCADPDTRVRALYVLAQLETMAGKPSAGPLWEALARKYPQSSLADDALFNQALVRRRLGDVPGERALLTTLVNTNLDADLRPEAIFRLFWSLRAEGKGRAGLVWLDQLASRPDLDGAEEERARYWRARTLLEPDGEARLVSPMPNTVVAATVAAATAAATPRAGESDVARAAALEAARADLVWLVEERPLTYHGLLARSRLAELWPELSLRIERAEQRAVKGGLANPVHEPLHAGGLWNDPHLRAGIELLRLGLRSEAARELAAVDRTPARNAGEAGEEPLVLLADLQSRAGDLRAAHQLVRTELRGILRRPARSLALRAAALAYPLAFREQIAKVSAAARIPPDLLQALMREESALDPRALSPTGALGLTQVMPATARMIARKLKLKSFNTAQLMEPDTNIRLGGTYLGELYSHFGHPALAIASYNAGPGAVGGWMRARGAMPLDAFVEEIPLEETRGYVKRCLRSYAAYQYLYGSSSARLPFLGQRLAVR